MLHALKPGDIKEGDAILYQLTHDEHGVIIWEVARVTSDVYEIELPGERRRREWGHTTQNPPQIFDSVAAAETFAKLTGRKIYG